MFERAPAIVADNAASIPSKRRKLQPCTNTTENPTSSLAPKLCDETSVCFGMLKDRPVIALAEANTPYYSTEAVFMSPREIRCSTSNHLLGQLEDYIASVVRRLLEDDELDMQLSFSTSRLALETDTKTKPPKGTIGFLNIILYGPKRRSGDMGYFMTECGYYLEDPVRCERNVPYMNPQYLFQFYEEPTMTFDLPHLEQQSVHEFTQDPCDILAGFETTECFKETATPSALSTVLKAHQRQALTFFTRREQGLHPSKDAMGIWSNGTDAAGFNCFVNVITDEAQSMPPPIWRGGLLADEMGLGKTLSMIALVASDLEYRTRDNSSVGRSVYADELESTLIVVPLSLLVVWKSQLESHVHAGKMTWCVHHGKTRFRLSDTAKPPNIVLTTYQTVEREKRSGKTGKDSLSSYFWKRIIIDEAHIIRNHKISTARAIASLRATCRWAISGTPIQNSLTDFLGFFKFLHFEPYDDPRAFDDNISNLWRTKTVDEATETFKKLLSSVMIRRTKAILELPHREDKIIELSFDKSEEELYHLIEQPVAGMLEHVSEDNKGPEGLWLNAIQQINRLRLICNLGTFTPSRGPNLTHSRPGDRELAVLSTRLSIGGEACGQCLQLFDSSLPEAELGGPVGCAVYYSSCYLLFCATCSILSRYQAPEPCACTEQPASCHLRPLISLLPTPSSTSTRELSVSSMETDKGQISSKVHAVISQIQRHPREKNVVFSSWTTSLDMLQRALDGCGIGSVRIDGKVAFKNREQVLQQFRNDSDLRVILITISCGACGLDLTAASRVHLLEPQWNPSLEDQAMARAHRLGQTQPVTTLRYIMKNSIEEHILKVQDRKKLLATTLLSNDSSLEKLRQLFKV